MSNDIAFHPVYLQTNQGLGNALRIALDNCTHDLVARMDSDDISAPYRFQKQLEIFRSTSSVDIVGGQITEFVGEPNNIVGLRDVELTDSNIKIDMKKRCAMNHMAVMYKKNVVQAVGGYQDWYYNEDYYLWIRMVEHGCKFANVPYVLVNVRTGAAMSARRGGWKYFRSEWLLQKYMLEHKLIAFPRYFCNVAVRFAGEYIATNSLRQIFYKIVRKDPTEITKEVKRDVDKEKSNTEVDVSYPPFSVAISVYSKDNAEWFDKALESIIVKQTVKPSEVVLVVDGPVSDPIQAVIKKYASICRTEDAIHS